MSAITIGASYLEPDQSSRCQFFSKIPNMDVPHGNEIMCPIGLSAQNTRVNSLFKIGLGTLCSSSMAFSMASFSRCFDFVLRDNQSNGLKKNIKYRTSFNTRPDSSASL